MLHRWRARRDPTAIFSPVGKETTADLGAKASVQPMQREYTPAAYTSARIARNLYLSPLPYLPFCRLVDVSSIFLEPIGNFGGEKKIMKSTVFEKMQYFQLGLCG